MQSCRVHGRPARPESAFAQDPQEVGWGEAVGLLVFNVCWWNLGVSITQRVLPVAAPGRKFGLGRLDGLKF